MNKYIVFQSDSDILIARLLGKSIDDRVIVNVTKNDKKGTLKIVKYEIGKFVYCIYNDHLDGKSIKLKIKEAEEAIAEDRQPEISSYRMSAKDAKEFLEKYEKELKFYQNKYFIDNGDNDVIKCYVYPNCKAADLVKVPFDYTYKGHKDNRPYIIEFEDDESAQLWAEVKRDEYLSMIDSKRYW